MTVTVQVAVYPVGQVDFRAVDAFIETLRAAGLDVRVGNMSSEVTGDVGAVFAALGHAFTEAASLGGTVVHVTASNACPT